MVIRPDLVGANMVEVSEHLLAVDLRCFIKIQDEAMVIEAVDPADEPAIVTRLESYTPVAAPDDIIVNIPDGVRTHLQHLRDYLAADPTTITNAQTVHVVRDLIRAVFYLNKRLETE